MHDFSYLHFEEDNLPAGQEPIQTEGLRKFCTFVTLLKDSKISTGYSTMGMVTGRAGIGKSIAIQAFLRGQHIQSHTGLPECIEIRVKPQSSPRALVEDLLTRLGERLPRLHGTSRNILADEAARAILSHDIRLIFVDEADQLNELGFEFLRYIFGKTGCPIVIVGLRSILPVLERHEKFKSRIGPRLDFPAPTEEEVLHTILPQLVFPSWVYDVTNQKDRAMGRGLWAHVQPSFRDLRVVLEYASQATKLRKENRITEETLQFVYNLIRSPRLFQRPPSLQEDDQTTAYEQESYQRQKMRRKRQPRTQEEE